MQPSVTKEWKTMSGGILVERYGKTMPKVEKLKKNTIMKRKEKVVTIFTMPFSSVKMFKKSRFWGSRNKQKQAINQMKNERNHIMMIE